MPPHFPSIYTPISDAGTQSQIRHVARLMASQMTNAGIGPGVAEAGYVPKMVNQSSMFLTYLCADTDSLSSQGNDFEDDDDDMDDIPGAAVITPGFRGGEDPESAKPGVASIQPAVQIRARQRALKLAEIAKPLTPQMNESMARSALQRVLKAERTAMLGGVAANRQKILASLATLFSGDFKDRKLLISNLMQDENLLVLGSENSVVLEYIMADPRLRIELAFSWLYEEYSMVMGFCRQSSIVKDEFRHAAVDSYTSVFCSLVNGLKKQSDLKEREA